MGLVSDINVAAAGVGKERPSRFPRLQEGLVPVLFAPYRGILIDGIKETDNDADREKQSQPPVPGQLFAPCHILQEGDDDDDDTDDIGHGLQQLPQRRRDGGHEVAAESQVEEKIEDGRSRQSDNLFTAIHMNSLKTLYFPGTAAPSLRLYPLFLLFQNVHFLSPVEPQPESDQRESADSFTNWGFCQVHTPRPLGADRQRFIHLLNDIASRGPDYATQLSALTLASITDRGPDESERTLVKSLLPSSGSGDDLEGGEKNNLWQERLLLAIGELLDQEEEEIALSLARFEDDEKRLFAELQGDDEREELEELLGGLTRLEAARRGNSTSNVRQRCQAWKRLYSTMDDAEFPILLARTGESGEVVRQDYERLTGQTAATPLTLPLPTVIGWKVDEAEQALRYFLDRAAPTLAAITCYLETLLNLDPSVAEQVQPLDEETLTAWQHLLDTAFPKEHFGRTALTFSLFPGWPTDALLSHPRKGRSASRNGLLAALG